MSNWTLGDMFNWIETIVTETNMCYGDCGLGEILKAAYDFYYHIYDDANTWKE